jgi:hypothetical protein
VFQTNATGSGCLHFTLMPYLLAVGTGQQKKISQEHAREFLQGAVNDYSLQYSQRYTELEIVKSLDPDLFQALVQWSDRPALPPPEWPPFT